MKRNTIGIICLVLISALFISCSDNVVRSTVREFRDPDAQVSENGAKLSQGYNYFDIPEGKTLYTLILNSSGSNSASYNLYGYDFKGASKALIPSDTSAELAIKTTRTDVYFALLLSSPPRAGEIGVTPSRGTVSYLGENSYNSMLFFIEENALRQSEEALNYTTKDGESKSVYVDYKNDIIPRLNMIFRKNLLAKERNYFGLSEYDVDGTGYFHVVFNDFGTNSANYGGKLAASGTTGLYNSRHIRTVGSTNKADMFFVNTRYIDIVVKNYMEYLEKNYSKNELRRLSTPITDASDFFYNRVANDIAGTLLHEYMHYLMDANIYLKNGKEYGASLLTEPCSLFWVEGMAEAAAYFMGEISQDGHSGFVSEWLKNGYKIYPAMGSELDSCMKYAVAPMFFLYLEEVYGKSTLQKFAQYSVPGKTLDVIVRDCTGQSFDKLYKDFILRLFAPLAGVSKYGAELGFAEDWSITKKTLNENCISVKETVESNSSAMKKDGAFLLKWESNPETLYVDSNCEVYAFYI